MKKIISLFSAVAVVASMFAAFATTSFAAASADSKPEIQGTVESVDGDGYAIMKFKLVNNEDLSYKLNRGKITSNGINTIQVKVTLDSTVFDTTETYMSGGFTGVSTRGDNSDTLTFVFAPTSVDSYMTTVPEYLFQIDALLKDGYTFENIPSSAVTFGETMIEYTSYNNVAASDGATTYTKYYVNSVSVCDYPLTVGFTGTAKDEPTPDPEPEEPADPTRKAITSSFTATSTDYVEVELVGKATNSYALPQGVKNGEAIVAGILKYTVGEAGVNGIAPVAGDVFKVYVKSVADATKAVVILTEEVK